MDNAIFIVFVGLFLNLFVNKMPGRIASNTLEFNRKRMHLLYMKRYDAYRRNIVYEDKD